MVEKRQSRDETLVSDGKESASDVSREEALLEGLPNGVPSLPTIHDDIASQLLELAERQVAEARKKLGTQSSKPRLKRIESLFIAKAGKAPPVEDDVERLIRSHGLAKQVANYDGTFDQTLATAFNNFDKSSVQAGGIVQLAHDNWTMAVRIYKSELRAAGAILAAEIQAAHHPSDIRDFDGTRRGTAQLSHYTKAALIGNSLFAYEKTMQQAGSDLATAFGQLIAGLYNAVNALAVAEATLIASTQGAYRLFWSSVQGALNQARD